MAEYPRDWMDQAACRDHDPELFFPERGPHANAAAAQAKAVCATCPVVPQCAAYVASTPHPAEYGIWAGTGPKQRRPSYEPPPPTPTEPTPPVRTKPPRPPRPPRSPCTYPGCDRTRHSYGLCNAHTLQRRRGRTLTPIRTRKPTE